MLLHKREIGTKTILHVTHRGFSFCIQDRIPHFGTQLGGSISSIFPQLSVPQGLQLYKVKF
jgi:hypothetical protein